MIDGLMAHTRCQISQACNVSGVCLVTHTEQELVSLVRKSERLKLNLITTLNFVYICQD